MDNIIWKDVAGYEGLYQVSNTGLVKSLARKGTVDRILSIVFDGKGYQKVGLSKKGVVNQYRVHRLVAEAFIPNPYNLPVVRHRDDYPPNNHMDNLRWGTTQDNIDDMVSKGRHTIGNKNAMAKLTEQSVLEIRRLWGEGGVMQIELAKMFDISKQTISIVLQRKVWKHI